jgi:minor extracellular serine protease Vpr
LDEIRPTTFLGRQDVQHIEQWSKPLATGNTPTLRSFLAQLFNVRSGSLGIGKGVIAAAITIGASALTSNVQALDLSERFPPVPDDSVFVNTMPLALSGDRRIPVVVILSADSVATARAKAADHKIGTAQKDAVEKAAIAQQESIKPKLEARGAKVLAQFHSALNGVKIEVEKSKIAAIAAMPGVVKVLPVGVYAPSNAVSVPFIGAPAVWQGIPGYRGENVKIAIIDTGIDYTHANFAGPGTVAAYQAALATDTAPANPAYFGPTAPKIKGGTDFVGDNYDANPNNPTYQPVPHPDPNPLDCEGHGSHVSGTAAGFGVLNGATYTGAYNSAAYQQHFDIGPGVAPKADLYAVKVFGCTGSTDVVTDAIDWAVDHGMDVINMSLGSDFGTANTADAMAAQNAALAGITVAISSGNSGPVPYISGSPASAAASIATAAMDATATFAGASLALSGVPTPVIVQENNKVPFANGVTWPVYVLRNTNGTVSFGCNESEYVDANIRGKLVVAVRGSTCARVLRAQYGETHGAAAVVLINNAAGYPPFEGDIPRLTGPGNVAIPFFGALPSDTTALTGPVGGPAPATATATNANVPNPGFETIASFSSGGPRYGDSLLKPDISAPGVSIFSTAVGTGNAGDVMSGTSMASPHVAGVAALVRQAHPTWSELAQRAAITQTADRNQIVAFGPRFAGAGLVQPARATSTQAYVVGTADAPDPLSFGFAETTAFSMNFGRNFTIHNTGTTAVQFNVNATPAPGVSHVLGLSSPTVTVPALGDAVVGVKLAAQAANIGLTHPAGTNNAFHEVGGTVTLTPVNPAMNGGATLSIPYYLVPRARSLVAVSHTVPSTSSPVGSVTVTNPGAQVPGTADFYAWGLSGTPQGNQFIDTRAVGVQSFPVSSTDAAVVFAVSTFQRISNAAPLEWDILIDTNGDGNVDYVVYGADASFFVSGQAVGRFASAVYKVSTNSIVAVRFADAPTDTTTFELLALASELGLSATSPRFRYVVQSFSGLDGSESDMPGVGYFNVFNPAISTGAFVTAAPNSSTVVPLTINPTEFAITPALGVMAVSLDNLNGAPQADLIPVH